MLWDITVGLVEKVPCDGIWQMIRHLLRHDPVGHLTNDWVDLDEFPMVYFTISWVAQFVSEPTVLPVIVPCGAGLWYIVVSVQACTPFSVLA